MNRSPRFKIAICLFLASGVGSLGVSSSAYAAEKANRASQRQLLWLGALKEFFTLPTEVYERIRRGTFGAAYEKITERTEKAESADEKPGCAPWENSNESSCSCDEVCPNDFRILETRRYKEQLIEVQTMDSETQEIESSLVNFGDLEEGSRLSFSNDPEDFADLRPRTVGYCWGMSHLLRRLKFLAFFDESAPRVSLKEYRKRVKRILRGQPTWIPGFASIELFSSDPEIQNILKRLTIREWRKHAVDMDSISIFFDRGESIGKRNAKKHSEEFTASVRQKLRFHQNPMVYFSHRTQPRYVHVVPIYKIVEQEDEVRFCFIDNHGTLEDHKNCGKYFSIDSNGNGHYSEWPRAEDDLPNLKAYGFTPEDRVENTLFVSRLKPYCEKVTRCKRR